MIVLERLAELLLADLDIAFLRALLPQIVRIADILVPLKLVPV